MTSYTNFVNRGRIGMIQGSNIVTGTDTMFVTDAVEGGVLFVNGASHPVIEVIDETHLRIGSIWWLEGYDQSIPYFIGLMDSKAATGIWANQQLSDMIARLQQVKIITDPFEQILELAQDGKLLGIATADPLQFEMIDALVTPEYDAQVADMAGRAAFDAEAVGFAVLVNDTGAGRAAIFTRIGAAGGWTTPAYITGPAYLMGVGTTTGIPFGESPLVTQTTKPGGSDLNFFIPEGMHVEVGTTTTLMPGSDASVTEEVVVGGIRLNFFIPEGLPGTIESVTPYWLSRIQYDTNAAEARIGLGATTLGDQLFTAADAESVRTILSAGDVNGPSSSVSGRIALFSGTTGKLLTQAGLSISDLEPARTLITQALAEGGTETAVKSWSSQRVRQNAQAAVDALPALRYDAAQSLTPLQKSWARANSDSGVLAGFRNKIINGAFEIWQRGASHSSSGYGSADRWRLAASGGQGTVSRQGLSAVASAWVPGEPKYAARLAANSTLSAETRLLQHVESARTLAGKKGTLSGYIRGSTGQTVVAEVWQVFGTGGSPSASVGVGNISLTMGPDFTRFDLVLDFPSVAGKTFGGNGDDFLIVRFTLPSGTASGQFFDLAHVSLVEGDATAESDPFAERHTQQELALCHRYYFTLANVGTATTGSATGWGRYIPIVYPVPMRVVPTLTVTCTHAQSGTFTDTYHAVLGGNAGNTTDLVGFSDLRVDAEL